MTKPHKAGSTRSAPCPRCGTPASGRFCPECGAVSGDATCASCQATLTPGARFCHDCGAPVAAMSAPAPHATRRPGQGASGHARRSNLPWILAGVAFVVLVVIYAAQRAGQTPSAGAAPPGGAGPGAVDVASMSPRERASRLFDRIMRLEEEGKRDSVQFFASMAIGIYESLGPLDLDQHYDLGRIAQVGGNLDLAAAQADSILRQDSDHLLGLILASAVAEARGDAARQATLRQRLLAAESAQLARGLQEYMMHRADIDAALSAARSR